jgi:feruloyl esterase
METLEKIYGGAISNGKRFFPGWPVGAEIAGANGRSGWDPWIVREGDRTISVTFAESFFRRMGFPERDPNYNLSRFDFDRDPARLEWIHNVLDATDADLSRFRSRGGKALMYYGWADPALNPLMGVEYYEAVLGRMGPGSTDFYRLFMVPGMFHCAGGVGTSTFDAVTPLITWVEKGVAPDRILASRLMDQKTIRQKNL